MWKFGLEQIISQSGNGALVTWKDVEPLLQLFNGLQRQVLRCLEGRVLSQL